MTSAPELLPIDTSTRYMSLRDAVCLIGRHYPDWRDEDVDQLAVEREDSTDLEAWDRAAHAEERLERWVFGKIIDAYDLDEHDIHRLIREDRLKTPYFEICARTGRFLAFPKDEWAPLAVDGPALQQKLTGIVPATPRKQVTYEWQPIVSKAWKIALEMKPPRTQAAIVAQLDDWYMGLEGKENSRLGEKELKQIARDIVAYLGSRRLSGELSPTESSPAVDPKTT